VKKALTILTLLLSYVTLYSQTNIELQTVPIELPDQSFYIHEVFDDRLDKHLGNIKDKNDNTTSYKLKGNAATTILDFISVTLKRSAEKKPIHLKIKTLEIQQNQTSIDEITTRIIIELVFFDANTLNEGKIFSISHTEDEVFSISETSQIAKTHEKRIRAAIEYCLLAFISKQSSIKNSNPEAEKMNTLHFQKSAELSKKTKKLTPWFNTLIFSKTSDKYFKGWNINYIGFSDSDDDFIIPFAFGYGQSKAKNNIVKERGYSSVDYYGLDSGLEGLLKIIPGCYANVGIQVPLGMEILKNLDGKKSHNFVIGIGAKQGIRIIPWKEYGIVFGAGFYQKFKTSKIHKTNFGFQFEVGVNL
jgi:hypothetical protein